MSRRFELLQLLEGYSPTREEESAYAQMDVLARESGDVLSRYHFDPGHFTASGFVVSDRGKGLLLVLHRRLGMWLQPGGHIEPEDEDLWAAARREIAEETGLTDLTPIGNGVFDVDVHHIPAARGEPGHEHHDVRFLFSSHGEASAGDGVTDIAWVPPEAIAGFSTDRSVLRAAAKLHTGSLESGSDA